LAKSYLLDGSNNQLKDERKSASNTKRSIVSKDKSKK
jgi:hypothetical protein